MPRSTVRPLSRLAAGVSAAAAVVAGAAYAGTADAATPSTTNRPAAHSCSGRHINREAPVQSHNDIFIAAPPRAVWKVQTDIDKWPTWKADVPYAHRLDKGPLHVGSRFRWSNGGLRIMSTVRALQHNRCTLWRGPSTTGIKGIHLWTFTPVTDGTLVHTEESWAGKPVEAHPAKAQAILDKGLAVGVRDLKREVESRQHDADAKR